MNPIKEKTDFKNHQYSNYYPWADVARIISIFAVVFGHSTIVSLYASASSDPRTLLWASFYHSLTRWSIPVFVMISGYFLLERRDDETYKFFYLKRARKLLVPTIFWVLFYSSLLLYSGKINSLHEFVTNILSGKPYYHLWFLYMIIPLYIVTPFFREWTRNLSQAHLTQLILLMFFLAGCAVLTQPDFSTTNGMFIIWFLYFTPFFFTGFYLRHYYKEINPSLLAVASICSSIIIFIGIYYLPNQFEFKYGEYFLNFLSIPMITLSLSNIALLMRISKPIISIPLTKKLGQLTFGVYLIHPIYFHLIRGLGINEKNIHPIVSIPVAAITVFILSLISAWAISKIPYIRRII